ncbi:uncharacterized protein LOC135850058 isoform X2 [Planococcus citri]|uniref:uncharacterized protein LOC135850058 isoform X2 n=1 Tax=Planococcus citri TaxID=170843 RepID=UPI0031F8E14D
MASSFTCEKCGKPFTKKYNLIRHIKACDLRVTNISKKHIVCPLCSEEFFRSSTLDEHLEKNHETNIICEQKEFLTYDDFQAWKEEIEKSSQSLYRKASVNNKAMYAIYYRCHRSGFFRSASTGKRKASTRGSCKIDRYCPSRIIAKKSTDRVFVRYFPTHVGHDTDIRFLHLPKTIEETIAHKLERGESLNEILNKRKEFIPNGNSEETKLINRKKLHNIRQKYSIPYAGNHFLNRSKSKSAIDEDTLVGHNQQTKEKEELYIEEATVVVTNSDHIKENFNGVKENFLKDDVCVGSSSHYDFHLSPSNSYIREEICETSHDLTRSVPEFIGNVSKKLNQALQIVDTNVKGTINPII